MQYAWDGLSQDRAHAAGHARRSRREAVLRTECAQDGTTSPSKAGRVTSPSYGPLPRIPALIRTLAYQSLVFHHIDRLHGPSASGPVYLRNLALLI
jgi:hypothetical protein